MKKRTEQDFKLDEYEDFYKEHYFQPFSDEMAVNIHEYLPRVAWALDVAQEIGAKHVLDLGCLEGFTLLTISNHTGAEGVGIDLSQEGIELATQRANRYELPVKFYQMTIEAYMQGMKPESFDLVCAFEVMEHVKDPALVFQLIDRVKTKDGTVLVSTPDFEAPTFGKDDEKNKCHIRLYTTSDADYEAENKYGHTRTATSLSKAIGKDRIQSMEVINELINCRYV